MNSLLLVEDDPTLGETLKEGLENQGFIVDWARSCSEANRFLERSRAKSHPFSLGILDVSLPDGLGFDLAKQIRKTYSFPFIFMTALNSAENRLAGYDLGAEEFIPKPFHFRELVIRLEHVLKTHAAKTGKRIRLPSGFLDLKKMCFEQTSGEITFLSLRDFRILKLLVEESPQPVSRDQMLNLIWAKTSIPIKEQWIIVSLGFVRF